MPNIIDALVDQSDLAKLFMFLLKQRAKDQYRGHQDYWTILKSIDKNFPMIGCDVTIQKEDKNGNISTVTHHVSVFDDLGNPVHSIDDIGGRCVKGEIGRKGSIHKCKKCKMLFCDNHVEFVDNNPNKPLCRYGFLGWEGCYTRYAKNYSVTNPEAVGVDVKLAQERLHLREVHSELLKVEEEIQGTQERITNKKSGKLLSGKKVSLLDRIRTGGVQTVECGNCRRSIFLSGIKCSRCYNLVDINVGSARVCPVCGNPIREVDCPDCEAVNDV